MEPKKTFRNEARNEVERQELVRDLVEQIYSMDLPLRVDVYPLEVMGEPDFIDTELANNCAPFPVDHQEDKGSDPYHDNTDAIAEDEEFKRIEKMQGAR